MTENKPRKARPNKGGQHRRAHSPKQFGKGAKLENSSVRHQGRVLAMQTLFEIDAAQRDVDDIVDRIRWDETSAPESALESPDEDERDIDEIPNDVADHAERLVRGTVAHLETIDPVIAAAAPAFPIAQIASVDRNVLRLAIYELQHERDVPVSVVINEAVEIAKRFGGENSGRFVNGVLGTVARQLPKDR